ncbi:MAG: hypothetical protein V3T45_02535, partial [Nitrospinaceae bacterium]
MKRVAIGLAALVVILVVGILVLYSSLGAIITKAVTTAGPEIIQAKVSLDETVIDATSGKGSMHGLLIGNPEGFESESAFKMDKIEITLDTGSITSDTIVINEINIQAPEVTYELGGSGSNIAAIQENVDAFVKKYAGASESKEKSEAKEGGTKMVIDHVYVKGGKVNISATLLGGKSMTVPLPDIHLKDIGKKENGATPGEVVQSLIGALNKAILKAVAPL